MYGALGVELQGDNIAVKLSTGEPPASNYLDPNLIADLVHLVLSHFKGHAMAEFYSSQSSADHIQCGAGDDSADCADRFLLSLWDYGGTAGAVLL